MKRTALLFSLALFATFVKADETDWLNFATDQGGSIVESVFFRNQGKLIFGETEMVYEDDGVRKAIPYTGGAYIFFSETVADVIESVEADNKISLIYSREIQQIVVSGVNAASQIRIVSMQGSLLRTVSNSQTISTVGLPQGIVIAIAVCDGKTISKKFIIK